jgi:hypothetical protein
MDRTHRGSERWVQGVLLLIDEPVGHFVPPRRVWFVILPDHVGYAQAHVRQGDGIVFAIAFELRLTQRGLVPFYSVMTLGVADGPLPDIGRALGELLENLSGRIFVAAGVITGVPHPEPPILEQHTAEEHGRQTIGGIRIIATRPQNRRRMHLGACEEIAEIPLQRQRHVVNSEQRDPLLYTHPCCWKMEHLKPPKQFSPGIARMGSGSIMS